MAQTRPIPDKRVGKAPIAEYSIVWKVARKLPRSVDCREVCFHYETTPTTQTTPTTTTSGSSTQTHWYSTFLETIQNWPLNSEKQKSGEFKAMPFTSTSANTDAAQIGSTVEYLFYSSAGFAIFLDDLHAWQIEVKGNAFCVSIRETATPPEDHPREYYSLKWRILVASGLTQLWEATIGTVGYINRPTAPPSSDLLQRIILPVSKIPGESSNDWEKDIISFKAHPNNPKALLLIDENEVNIPFHLNVSNPANDPKKLITEYLEKGTPIAFKIALKYSVKLIPAGVACVGPLKSKLLCTLDFTNDHTALWFIESLEKFTQKTGISTFFLQDATVDKFLSEEKKLLTVENPVILKYPNFLTTLYASLARPFASGSSFAIDGAFKAQRLSSFLTFQMESGFRDYTLKNALGQFIPKLLTFSLAGYQFVFPQILLNKEYDEEEYRRWLSVCLFLPALQLPTSPWNFKESFEAEMRELLDLRVAVHKQVQMETLISDWIHRGVPIIRPMWAADESDAHLFTIDDQYMLGPDLVVAPYLTEKDHEKEAYERSVYLPRGNWSDPKGNPIESGKLIKVDSTLMAVPYFTRQEKTI